MKKEDLIKTILSVVILSVIVIAATAFFVYEKRWIGIVFVILGFLHLFVLSLFRVNIKAVWPDIIFGVVDNGFLAIGAVIGADFAGVLGAIIGAAAVNAITDGLAGIFEGWTSEYLRKHKIQEKRTALGSALGKMAGCLFGAGIIFIIVWTAFYL